MQIQVKMSHTKSTKGTHVFEADDDTAGVTNVYVKRSAFQGDPPAAMTLTMTDEADGPKPRMPKQ